MFRYSVSRSSWPAFYVARGSDMGRAERRSRCRGMPVRGRFGMARPRYGGSVPESLRRDESPSAAPVESIASRPSEPEAESSRPRRRQDRPNRDPSRARRKRRASVVASPPDASPPKEPAPPARPASDRPGHAGHTPARRSGAGATADAASPRSEPRPPRRSGASPTSRSRGTWIISAPRTRPQLGDQLHDLILQFNSEDRRPALQHASRRPPSLLLETLAEGCPLHRSPS